MRKKILGWGLLAAFVLTAGAGLVLRQQFYGNAVVTERDLYVSVRAEYGQVADSLLPQIKHRRAFDAYARRINLAETFKPGHYVLKHGMSVIEIARMLKLGLQTPVRVTINNVRIPAQLAQKLARQIDADSTAIMQALTSEELAAEVGFDSVTLFSMFIPDSYEFYWTVTPGEFVRRMKREYDRFWTSERDVKRKRSGLSRLEVMTLASIVYEETRKSDEMPRVAGVYVNRLKKGIKLQADPTVKYAMQDFGLRRILYRHLKYDSPYNTYVNEGLPPSPICMPGKNAIDAVLNYEKHDYIFFCARPEFDGYHNFAKTLREHNKNARAYSDELNRRKIKEFLYLCHPMLAKIYEQNPSEKELQRVVDALERDEIIIYPTDSVYAFGCSLRSPKAIERLRRIRGKSEEKFTVVFENIAQVAEYCRVDNAVFRILKRNLPGPFTFVLAASARIPDKALERRRTIGVRIPASPVARAVVGALGCPMITTSVKDDDQVVEYTTDPELIHERYGREVALVIDGGIGDNVPTTVVDLTGDGPEILREGKGELQ